MYIRIVTYWMDNKVSEKKNKSFKQIIKKNMTELCIKNVLLVQINRLNNEYS